MSKHKRPRNYWTDEDVERLIALRTEGLSTIEIAEAMGKRRKAVYHKLWILNREGAMGQKDSAEWNEAADAALLSMLEDDLPIVRIARMTGKRPEFIRERIEALAA